MNIYRVFYLGEFKKHFHDRDEALDWVAREVEYKGFNYLDFEILDNSDYL
jgi:hypothetical protein